MSSTADLLDRDAFREWLESKAPEAVVGIAREGCDCPLARFFWERGAEDVMIERESLFVSDAAGEHDVLCPSWAERFIDRVDAEEHVFGTDTPITAARALAILEKPR